MKTQIKRLAMLAASLLVVAAFSVNLQAQGKGRMEKGQAGGNAEDMNTIHAMFDEHQKIARTVKKIENGVETTTESDDPKVQAMIAEHAWAMKERLEKKRPIRAWDPLFEELFKNSEKIRMEVTKTPKGVKVVETSTDSYVVKLIQSHAMGVSEFVKEGTPSMHKRHELPEKD